MPRRILATSGGFLPTDRWMVSRPGGLVLEALRLTGQARPRVRLLETAGGDDRATYLRRYAPLSPLADVTHLELWPTCWRFGERTASATTCEQRGRPARSWPG